MDISLSTFMTTYKNHMFFIDSGMYLSYDLEQLQITIK